MVGWHWILHFQPDMCHQWMSSQSNNSWHKKNWKCCRKDAIIMGVKNKTFLFGKSWFSENRSLKLWRDIEVYGTRKTILYYLKSHQTPWTYPLEVHVSNLTSGPEKNVWYGWKSNMFKSKQFRNVTRMRCIRSRSGKQKRLEIKARKRSKAATL